MAGAGHIEDQGLGGVEFGHQQAGQFEIGADAVEDQQRDGSSSVRTSSPSWANADAKQLLVDDDRADVQSGFGIDSNVLQSIDGSACLGHAAIT